MMVLCPLSRVNEGVTLRGTPSSLDLAWMRLEGLLRSLGMLCCWVLTFICCVVVGLFCRVGL